MTNDKQKQFTDALIEIELFILLRFNSCRNAVVESCTPNNCSNLCVLWNHKISIKPSVSILIKILIKSNHLYDVDLPILLEKNVRVSQSFLILA